MEDRYDAFPAWFFDRADPGPDAAFYRPPRMVTHIDEGAVAAVGDLYEELGIHQVSPVLDLMSSWVSHFRRPPAQLTVLGMNAAELEANAAATDRVVQDLNLQPQLPFGDATFGAAVCCVSVDYLVRPLEVFDEVARVLRPGGVFACTFSDRCFPTKAVAGWLRTDDEGHARIVAEYFRRSVGWDEPVVQRRPTTGRDPLYAVWARRSAPG